MKQQPEIQINRFQLAILLDDERMDSYRYLLEVGVYCTNCADIANEGIIVEEIFLTGLNDIMVRGKCKVCKGNVARIMEFGEDEEFFKKANLFRKAIEG